MQNQWIIIGGGGHAAVVAELIQLAGGTISGYTANAPSVHPAFKDVPFMGTDQQFLQEGKTGVCLANGIGSNRSGTLRQIVYERYVQAGYVFPALLHPTAIVSGQARIAASVQVMAGAIIQPYSQIEENCIINTSVVVEHDCMVGAHVHLSPGAVLCGAVIIGSGSHIGARAVIREGIRTGDRVTIGLGAVVVEHVQAGTTVAGCPAKPMKAKEAGDGR